MKKFMVLLVAVMGLSTAQATMCEDAVFGSPEWWQCQNQSKPILGEDQTRSACDAYEFGSPEWWQCQNDRP